MKVAVIANSAKCSREAFYEMLVLLGKKEYEVVATSFASNRILMEPVRIMPSAYSPDLVFVIGGDGTIISAAHFFGKHQAPIVGVNLGKLGYLANFSYEECCDMIAMGAFPRMLGTEDISERMLLGTQIKDDHDVMAVNDIVIDIGHPFRTITVRIDVDGKWLTDVRGDGVIVSTPTGSTAYNLSAGGPILQPETDVIAITPKNPHALSFRPLVVRGSSTITLTAKEHVGAHVIIDGQKVVPMSELDGDEDKLVKIGKFESNLKLVSNQHNQKHGWSNILREKLKWGV